MTFYIVYILIFLFLSFFFIYFSEVGEASEWGWSIDVVHADAPEPPSPF